MWSQQFNERLKEEAAPVGLTSSEILRSSSSPPHSPVRAPEELLLSTCMTRLQAGKGKEGELLRKTIHFFYRDNFEIAGAQVRLQKSPSLSPHAFSIKRDQSSKMRVSSSSSFAWIFCLFVVSSRKCLRYWKNKRKSWLIRIHLLWRVQVEVWHEAVASSVSILALEAFILAQLLVSPHDGALSVHTRTPQCWYIIVVI